ncbi:MAG: hypothetical protein EHM77_04945, partial [Planctomycetaceae bacterium]
MVQPPRNRVIVSRDLPPILHFARWYRSTPPRVLVGVSLDPAGRTSSLGNRAADGSSDYYVAKRATVRPKSLGRIRLHPPHHL